MGEIHCVLSVFFLHFCRLQPPRTSVAGWQWHLLEQPGTGKTLVGVETSSSVGGSSGLVVMAKSHCFFGLSILPLLGPRCGVFTEVGRFWPEDLIGDPENAGEVMEREEL